MPFKIVRNDITKMKVDAIVNAANNTLLGGGGVDGAIHYAAGPDLYKECLALGGCETGDAKITGAYRLPCKYIIHTVGPIWIDGKHGEREQLISCYRRSLQVARENGCETVAFPLISSGVYGYPKDKALKVASDTISEFLYENDMTVYLVIYSKAAYDIGEKLFNDIAAYIDDNYVERHTDTSREDMRRKTLLSEWEYSEKAKDTAASESAEEPRLLAPQEAAASIFKEVPEDAMLSDTSLNDTLNMLDEGFSEMLLRKIDERGMTDVECYKKANIDRKLFSKIRSNANYKPSKPTVLAFAIALELSLDETKELLMKAGFALSHSFKSDVIVEYFISRGIYDIFTINEALFAFDQTMLGA